MLPKILTTARGTWLDSVHAHMRACASPKHASVDQDNLKGPSETNDESLVKIQVHFVEIWWRWGPKIVKKNTFWALVAKICNVGKKCKKLKSCVLMWCNCFYYMYFFHKLNILATRGEQMRFWPFLYTFWLFWSTSWLKRKNAWYRICVTSISRVWMLQNVKNWIWEDT